MMDRIKSVYHEGTKDTKENKIEGQEQPRRSAAKAQAHAAHQASRRGWAHRRGTDGLGRNLEMLLLFFVFFVLSW